MQIETSYSKKISIPFFLSKDYINKQDNLFIKQKDVHLLKMLYQKGMKDNVQVETPNLEHKVKFPKLNKQFTPFTSRNTTCNSTKHSHQKQKAFTIENQHQAMLKTNVFVKMRNKHFNKEKNILRNFSLSPVNFNYQYHLSRNKFTQMSLKNKLKQFGPKNHAINLHKSKSTINFRNAKTCEQECQTSITCLKNNMYFK